MYSKIECPECGESRLSWGTHQTVTGSIVQGRLNTSDVKCVFILGCDYCSETIMVVDADTLAVAMSEDK
jgi:hypothetical protein